MTSDQKYSLILADPAWSYRQGGRGAARNHYPTMKLADIQALPVASITADDAVLFVWGTWPNLEFAIPTMNRWGFEFKTLGFLWVKHYGKSGKPFWGGGFWSRSNSEFCLLGVRGNPKRISASVHQLVETWDERDDLVLRAPIDEHSAKPPEVRNRIVQLVGDLPRIELFARERADGWHVWGNDPALGDSDVDFSIDANVEIKVNGLPELGLEPELKPEFAVESKTETELIEIESEARAESETQLVVTNEPQTQGEIDMASLPKEMADSVGKARTAGGGNYIQHGDYMFMVQKWFYQKVQDRCIITEFTVVDAVKKPVFEGTKKVDQDPNPIGNECSETVNFDGAGKQSADGNARAVVLGLFGYREGDIPDSTVSATLTEVCDDKQPARGMLIACSTFPKEKRSKPGEFITGRNWSCVDKPGTGANAPDKVAARLAAFSRSTEEGVRVTREQLGKPAVAVVINLTTSPPVVTPPTNGNGGGSGGGGMFAVPAPAPAPVLAQVATAPAIPATASSLPPPPIAVVDPFAGWAVHPADANFYYKGQEVKSKADLLAAAGK